MNRILLLITVFSVGILSCTQQRSPIASQLQTAPQVEPQERNVKLNNQTETAHTLDFVSDRSTTLSAWRSFVKDELKQKLDKRDGMYVAESVMISRISSGPISLYSNVEEKGEGSELQVWVKSGEEFVSHSTKQDISLRVDATMKDFANQFYGKHYQLAIKNEEETQKELAEELGSLEKQRKSIVNNLEENKEEIAENEEEINELQREIDELQKENENLAKANNELEKEQRENKKAIEEQQKMVETKKQEVQKLRANSQNFK